MICFKLFGMQIRIKFLFVAVVTMFLLTDNTNMAITALLACIIHELGHLLMFVLVGCRPQRLDFELTGIRLEKPAIMLSYGREILVQAAGSATNFLVFALLAWSLGSISDYSICAVTHLVVGVFNLLPIKSFDGGKLLELLLLRITSARLTAVICSIVDICCILVLLVGGIYALCFKGGGFTLLLLSIFLLISAIARLWRQS